MTKRMDGELKYFNTNLKEKEDVDKLNIQDIDGVVIVVYDEVVIRSGEILFNPFNKSIETPNTLTWILQNLTEVEKIVGYWLREYYGKRRGANVDDCVGLVIDYFSQPDRDFKENYTRKKTKTGKKYTIERYCKGQLKYIVLRYLRGIEDTRTIVTKEEFEQGGTMGVVDDSHLVADFIDSDRERLSRLLEDEEYHLYEIIYQDLGIHKEYFNQFGYKDFCVKTFIYYMFLNVLDTTNAEQQLRYVARKTKEPYQLIFELVKDLRRSYNSKDERAIKLIEDVKYLNEGQRNGWELPPLN